jgi:AraC-like DNA-binding protein
MQQLAHKNPWKTVFVIVAFVFLTTALSIAAWFYRYSRLQKMPPPSAQAPRATRPVARIMADPQAAMVPLTGTPGKSRSLPEQIPARPRFEISLDPMQEFQEDLRKALLHDLISAFPELPKFLGDPMAKSQDSAHERFAFRRIEFACLRLANSREPLVEIASEAGFCDQAHLTRTFRTFLGCTPADYRRCVTHRT